MSVPADILDPAAQAARDAAARPGRHAASLHNTLVYGLCALLSFGPLAFGATEPWSVTVLEIGTSALVLVWMAKQVSLRRIKIRYNPLYLPMSLLALLVLFQLVSGMTAYRYITTTRATLFLAYAAIFFVVVQTLRSDRDLKLFSNWFSIFGFLVALFAIVQGLTDKTGKLYWVRLPRFGGWTYGPYVDHSHYAGLMEMLLPLPLVMAVLGVQRGNKRVLLWLFTGTMMASIFLSQSRGGVLAMLIELAFLAAVAVPRSSARRHHRTGFAAVAAAIVFLAFVAWLGGDALLERFSVPRQQDLVGPGRPLILKDSVRLIAHKPVTGWGLGTYPLVFPQVRSFYTSLFINHAHNDYAELVAETGIVGAVVIAWFLFALYRAGLSKVRNRQSRTIDAVTLYSLTSCTAIVAHSFWDFNLQIPANAALFFALCGLASARLTAPRVREQAAAETSAAGEADW
ncbi:MAG: O-antigen ligase family protein [Acidobacteriia bacterium]|nr:O-antigen ligase family protein [Terriglobia bacterium]